MTIESYRRVVLPIAVSLLVLLGIWLRYHGISEHFAHVDDLVTIAGPYLINQGYPRTVTIPGIHLSLTVDAQRIKSNPLLYAAYVSGTTYAPLQFLFYPLVLSGDYSYRGFLLRGRLPSAIFASLALLVFVGLYRAYSGGMDSAGLLGLGVLSLSLMNITYAQQAMAYAIGVLAAGVLVWLLVCSAKRPTTMRTLLRWALLSAVLAYANYQVLVMVPLAYAALAASEFLHHRGQSIGGMVRRYLISASVFAVLALPLIILLRQKTQSRLLMGIGGFESFFPALPAGGLLDKVAYTVSYAGRGLYTVIATNVTFALGDVPASVCVWLLFLLFVAGAWSLVGRSDPASRALVIFVGLVAVAWGVLNGMGRFPLSPTRHVLVLSPIIVLLIAVGTNHILRRLHLPFAPGEVCVWGLLAVMLTLFAAHYGQFRADRKDKFDEAMAGALLTAHHLDTIVGYDWTWNPALMFRRSGRRVTFLDLEPIIRRGPASKVSLPDGAFLLASQYGPIERYPTEYAFLTSRGFRIRNLVRMESDIQPGISKAIKWGSNGLYLSLAEK